jgi:hypothetical protein
MLDLSTLGAARAGKRQIDAGIGVAGMNKGV